VSRNPWDEAWYTVDGNSIVFVHGLQGHPRHTWAWSSTSDEPINSTPIQAIPKSNRFKFWIKPPRRESASTEPTRPTEQVDVYWPYHLLCEDCPRCRILTWGYDSKLTNFFKGSANKNHIFAHSRDLLSDLKGRRLPCVRDSDPFGNAEADHCTPR